MWDENEKFKYIPEPRNYTPDFYLSDSNIYVEAKGHLTKDDRVKMVLIKKQHPELDIRFVFQSAKTKIRKGSKTTYADYCDKHGILWAEKEIPKSWLNEKKSK